MSPSRRGSARKTVRHPNIPEIVSLVFVMGQFLKEKMHKKIDTGRCSLFEFETMRFVRERERPFMRDIAKKFHVSPPAATLLIDGLAKQGMLERLVDPGDRRAVRVALTAKGRRFLDRGMKLRVKELEKIFSVLTPSERSHFAALLKKITRNGA
jgi:DNA-binding MarR family transcriptional regulator